MYKYIVCRSYAQLRVIALITLYENRGPKKDILTAMKQPKQFHHIQKSILLSLAKASPLRFSELQPPRAAKNVFSYHIKQLLEQGYLDVSDAGYTLTRKALKLTTYIDTIKYTQGTPSLMTSTIVKNSCGEILLVNKNTQPFSGWYTLPSGLIHAGESIPEAAKRELLEKTMIATDQELKFVGVLDFIYKDESTDDVFSHIITFVHYLEYTGDPAIIGSQSTHYGQLSWSTMAREHILPEAFKMVDMLKEDMNNITSVSYQEPPHMPVLID
jgi:ADP-ribose pyrophosphatase YjhB (NUDIX family)